jgi:FkbM family methyltransferase
VNLRPIAGRGVDALCRLVGRRQVVRAARFALYRSRLDLPNDPRRNGEFALQRWILDAIPAPGPVTVLDVGAHVGLWSLHLLTRAGRSGHRLDLHTFEPTAYTNRLLTSNLPDWVRVNQLAVSDQPGEALLHVVGPSAGRNSLHHVDGLATTPVPVATTTIDEYATRNGINHIDLLKIDAEGHDLRVLHGATHSFERYAVSVAQFEYNHRWVYSKHFLKEAFDLLGPLGYRIAKLTPYGLEWYRHWDPDLETFVEGNYVACTHQMAQRLPGVRWWKDGAGPCTLD